MGFFGGEKGGRSLSLGTLRTIFLLLSTKSILQEVFQLSERSWLTFSYKTCSAERGENFSQKEVRGLFVLGAP